MDNKKLLNFFFELGQLKMVEHEGWRLAGINHPETVSAHSLRAAQIGYVLAKLENYANPAEVCSMLVFHDIAECRTGDIHKVANRYVTVDDHRAAEDQLSGLEEIGKDISALWHQVEDKSTAAGVIAKDADYLEQAITAKEYMEQGHAFAENWIDNVSKNYLKTFSAQKLLADLKKADSNDWWQGLKKL